MSKASIPQTAQPSLQSGASGASGRPSRWRVLRLAGNLLRGLVIVIVGLWGALAVWFSNLPWANARLILSLAFAVLALFALLRRPRRLRPEILFFAAFVGVLIWWSMIKPSTDRDWSPDAGVLATATFDGDRVTIHNVRNFDYAPGADFSKGYDFTKGGITAGYYDKTVDLNDLRGMDFCVSYFLARRIAHTFVSFGFADGYHLAVSIEVRKEKGESYSPLNGIFKQYELMYVIGDERDVVRVRTNYRGEDVYVYPTTFTPEEVRTMFTNMLRRADKLAREPEWYHSLVQNCTTTIVDHVLEASPRRGDYNWRILLNGYSDELAYERGRLDTDLPYAEARKRHHINERAKAAEEAPDFSRRIREPWLKG